MIDRCKFIHNLPCEQVSDRIIELEDENAKLDRRRRSLHADVERLGGIIHRQRKELSTMQYAIECRNDENAKLRELCKDIWNDALHFEGFWDYVHDDGEIYDKVELPRYQERMRELGIEVKDD